jgi:outer membrane protein assembly factor BamB
MNPRKALALLATILAALALTGGAASAQLSSTSPWPKFQHDEQNTGRSDLFEGPATLPTVVWQERFDGPRRAAPAIGDGGTLMLGVGRWPLVGIDSTTGAQLFTTSEVPNKAGLDRAAPAVAADGTVYFGARDNNLWSIDPSVLTGTPPDAVAQVNWRFKVPTDGDVSTPPAIGPDGRIYMASDALGAGKFYAMNPDGSVDWTVNLGGAPINVSPALSHDGSVVYVTTGGRRLHALSTADGSDVFPPFIAQPQATGSRVFNFSPVVGKDGTIYLTARSSVVAVNPNGTEKWRFDPDPLQFGSPVALGPDDDMSGLEDVLYTLGYTKTSTLFALDPTDGSVLWQQLLLVPGKARNTPPIVDAAGRIYLGVGKVLYAFGPAGNALWTMLLGHRFDSSPILGGDGILYVGNGHELFKLSE